MPLGLVSSETVDDYWFQNTRRRIFYSYPNGTAPLTGFLSLADTESTPNPEPGWQEERWLQLRSKTAVGPTSNTVFYLAGSTTTAGATFTPTAGTTYRIYVDDSTKWMVEDHIVIHGLPLTVGTTETTFRIKLTGSDVTNNYVEAECVSTATGAVTNNASTVVGLQVVSAGSAYAEGSRSGTGRFTFPIVVKNFTQIWKSAFEMTRTALKAPTTYDKTGAYKDQLKQTGINHMAGIEWDAFFGNRRATTATDPDTGNTVRRSFMGGLLWYLKQWEFGNVSNGGAFDYRPGDTNLIAQTSYTTYRDKRIIRLGGATVTADQFDAIEALPFQKTNSTQWCKLCLAGAGYIAKMNSRYKGETQVTQLRENQFDGWDFKVTQKTGLMGDIYYKQHPLFNKDEMYNSAFYVDLGYLKWRPLDDSDTDIQQCIQLPDADKRKDQWLTEGTIEIAFPEAHMFVDGLGGVSK